MEATIRLAPVKETKDLVKFMAEVPPADLRAALRQISAFEIEQQRAAGNTPSAIIVDGTRKSIAEAMRRVVALFGDTSQIAAAVHEAFRLLRDLTRQKSGTARGSYRLLLNDHAVGDEGATDRVVPRMTNRDNVEIIGPLTAYGRKLYWNPRRGGDAPRSRIMRKQRGTYREGLTKGKVKVYVRYREPMHATVVRLLSRKYRALTIREAWINTPLFAGVGSDSAAPAIMIRFKAGRAVRGRGY